MDNQNTMIMRHLNDFGSITAAEAVSEYGIYRLASRIADLRKSGVAIGVKSSSAVNRYGKKVSFAEYFLIGGRDE